MAVTYECDSGGSRIVDTAAATGPIWGPSFVTSLAVAEHSRQRLVVATGVSNQAINFGTVAAAKVFEIVSDYVLTVKVNGEATGHACKRMRIIDEDGGITAATVTNASGSTATIEVLLAGAT